MAANTLAPWANILVVSAELSAALRRLVIAAVSLILKYRQLAGRAISTIAVLMLAIVTGLASLIPQSATALAAEVLLVGAGVRWLGHSNGLSLIAAAIMVALLCAASNAWVLLVEGLD